MTDKEKARAYDEAIRKAQDVSHTSEFIKITDLFPQLSESEDERIREFLIGILSQGTWRKEWPFSPNEVVAYLERQNHVQYDTEKEYVRTLKSLIFNFLSGKDEVDRDYYQRIEDWLDERHIEQKEQKPANLNLTTWHRDVVYCAMCDKNLDEGLRCNLEVVYKTIKELVDRTPVVEEQNLAEWSDEDEAMIKSILFVLESYVSHSESASSPSLITTYPTYYKEIDWLKSLRPSWKPSEDEVRLINTSISFLKDFADKGYENAVECIDWLKSKLNGNTCK